MVDATCLVFGGVCVCCFCGFSNALSASLLQEQSQRVGGEPASQPATASGVVGCSKQRTRDFVIYSKYDTAVGLFQARQSVGTLHVALLAAPSGLVLQYSLVLGGVD